MKGWRLAAIFLSFTLIAGWGFAQEGADLPRLTGEQIFENWNKGAVAIFTNIKLENGEELIYSGAGAFRDENGHIVTNNHVVKVEGDVIVRLRLKIDDEGHSLVEERIKVVEYRHEIILNHLNRRFSAELIGWAPDADLAMLKVNGVQKGDYYVGKAGDSDKARIGQTVYVIGFPIRIPNSTTKGIVSQLHRQLGLSPVEDYIQVDAAVNRGNSGGVVINEQGELIGIVNSKNFGAEGIGYAIPINLFDLNQFLKGGEIKRLILGVDAAINNPPRWGTHDRPRLKDLLYLQTLTGMEADNDLETLTNLYRSTWINYAIVGDIQKGSPAEKSGLFKRGDLIIKAGGRDVRGGMDLREALWGWDPAKPFEIEILRFNGSEVSRIKLKVNFAPAGQPPPPSAGSNPPNPQKENQPNSPKKDDRAEKKKWS